MFASHNHNQKEHRGGVTRQARLCYNTEAVNNEKRKRDIRRSAMACGAGMAGSVRAAAILR